MDQRTKDPEASRATPTRPFSPFFIFFFLGGGGSTLSPLFLLIADPYLGLYIVIVWVGIDSPQAEQRLRHAIYD